jgi:hypothetical protein
MSNNDNTSIIRPARTAPAPPSSASASARPTRRAAARDAGHRARRARAGRGAGPLHRRAAAAAQRRAVPREAARALQAPGLRRGRAYEKPVGGQKIKGPSIRFVETALQEFGNVLPEETITYDDDYKRVTMVKVTDLERTSLLRRRDRREDGRAPSPRTATRSSAAASTVRRHVYKIRATEDDFANKIGAACSKKLRNLGIRILPADIVAEAMDVCRETRDDKDAQDPAAARRQLADAFAALRVMPADLDAFLGHRSTRRRRPSSTSCAPRT